MGFPRPADPVEARVIRERLHVRGVVQGVGFRPFVHSLATGLGLAGFVGNDAGGVFVELEGPAATLTEFQRRLGTDAPRLAVIDGVRVESLSPVGASGFTIAQSTTDGVASHSPALIPPDVAACEACLAEIADPADRRYRYPFGNCTDCGPRFTVITATPYDRVHTTMAGFTLCPDCARERADVGDRRFHAEPIACPACGPQLACGSATGDAALAEARRVLSGGGIVAVKGLGGFHLACDAAQERAVVELRRRKRRPDKPFALLVADLEAARAVCAVDEDEAAVLTSPARPIVLLRARPDAAVAAAVAPGLDELGVQLPSTPLQVLLLAQPGPQTLLLTSGNIADEPICFEDGDARVRLGPLVDAALTHDRPIHLPCDDSVTRVVDGHSLMLRRSRGFAPLPVRLVRPVRPVLAVGGDLKAALCLASGTDAWPGQHIGDLTSLEGTAAMERSARHLVKLLHVVPEIVACDQHPGYSSVRLAQRLAEQWGVPLVRVQHHHAHVVSALAEARVDGAAVGLALDGTGFGSDGSVWGGELLLVASGIAQRLGHLGSVLLPGGDAAARRPALSALAHLWAAGVAWEVDLPPVASCSPTELDVVRRQLGTGFGCTATSSAGRLFDAVAALCGVRQVVSYEAQAALELEVLSRTAEPGGTYRFDVADGCFDAAPVIRAVVADLRAGVAPGVVGARFTASVADVLVEVALAACTARGVSVVALSGGVFANTELTRRTRAGLERAGLRVVTHGIVPCGDGGLSLGQAVVAGHIPTEGDPLCV